MKNLIFGIIAFFAFSASLTAQEVFMSVEPVEPVESGGVVNFKVICEEIDNEVSTFQWFFKYDEKYLSPIGVINYHENFPEFEWMNNMNYGPGYIILTWLSNEGRDREMKQGAVICELQFEYEGGQTELEWVKAHHVVDSTSSMYSGMWIEDGSPYYMKFKNATIGK